MKIPASRLAWALRATLPHVSVDDTLPSLNHVQVVLDGTALWFIATDRYTAAVTQIEVPAADRRVDGLLRADLAKELLAVAGKARRNDIVLFLDQDNLTASPDWPGGFYSPPTYRWPWTPELTFPDVASVVAKGTTERDSTPQDVCFNPALLARLKPLADRVHPVTLRVRGTGMAAAYVETRHGQAWVGVMPVRTTPALPILDPTPLRRNP